MRTGRYRAWRFVHPDFDQATEVPGLGVSNRGGIDMVEGALSVRQAILLLISTRPGERVMRPHYGCHLQRLVFAPNDDTTAGLAMHYVRQALERWEPRVDIVRLDAKRSEDDRMPGLLEINLEYHVRATQQNEFLTYRFDVMGERS